VQLSAKDNCLAFLSKQGNQLGGIVFFTHKAVIDITPSLARSRSDQTSSGSGIQELPRSLQLLREPSKLGSRDQAPFVSRY
jgi:hypothetical protein